MTTKALPPKNIKVGSITFALLLGQDMSDDKIGETDTQAGTISLSKNVLSPDLLRQVVMHELIHASMSQVPSHAWFSAIADRSLQADPDNLEEAMCQMLESPLLQIIRDNPVLVRWLTG